MLTKIAITGSTASGKSTVTKILSEFLNAENYSADKVVAEFYGREDFCQNNLLQFQQYIFNEKNTVDKNKLKDLIVQEPENLKIISKIVWKEFHKKILEIFKNCKTKSIIFEIPLLFESNSDKFFDIIINVESNLLAQKNRAEKLSGIKRKFFDIFIQNQVSNEFRKLHSNFTIENFDGLDELQSNVEKIAMEILSLKMI